MREHNACAHHSRHSLWGFFPFIPESPAESGSDCTQNTGITKGRKLRHTDLLLNTQGMEIIPSKAPDQDELSELKQLGSLMGEADSLCENLSDPGPNCSATLPSQRVRLSTPIPTELLETPLPQEQGSSRGGVCNPTQTMNQSQPACRPFLSSKQGWVCGVGAFTQNHSLRSPLETNLLFV